MQIALLAIIQGLAELLPVSSSAHVVVAEKLMGLDPAAPALTLLLVMLHTGTMFAVIVYFWRDWRRSYFSSSAAFRPFAAQVAIATAITGAIALGLQKVLVRVLLHPSAGGADVEDLFGHLELIAPALFAASVLIVVSALIERRRGERRSLDLPRAGLIGAVQGLCLPFRGFSRSGATISVALVSGIEKHRAEVFSFALAVVLTPFVVAREVLRLHARVAGATSLHSALAASVLGGLLSFLAGLLALRWISRWLEGGRWHYFGIYCLLAAAAVAALHYLAGY
ncbi:MAG TPA: undecaprenyl-diphosphate phosphatase [Steroidobacteraceae bacterium]|nr:undecaprenyl-diphosphate phosphatase [Steroidobacteraceae bacterium]